MSLTRRSFLKFTVAGTAGLLLPEAVAAEPGRRVWALDRTMLADPWAVERRACSDYLEHLARQRELAAQSFLETGRFDLGPPPGSQDIGDPTDVFGVSRQVDVAPGRLFVNGVEHPTKDFSFVVNGVHVTSRVEHLGNGRHRYVADLDNGLRLFGDPDSANARS